MARICKMSVPKWRQIAPDIMVLLPIVAGIIGGPARGATIGFGTGLVSDLFLPTPFGLSALVGCLLGFGVELEEVRLDPTTGRRYFFFRDPDDLPLEIVES